MNLLTVQGLSKSYGLVKALDQVSVEFEKGEIHGVLGENGAGKSTLVGILAGFVTPDSGHVAFNGDELIFGRPFEAQRKGIEMVHQHFTLVPEFSVAENLALFRLKGLLKRASSAKLSEAALQLGMELGWELEPRARTGDLPVGAQQRLEILKALSGNAEVLILDEPTAVLSPSEVSDLFTVLKKLRATGKTVLLIAHKLREVLSVADRVTVLRQGRRIATAKVADVDEETLARWMVGEMPSLLSKGAAHGGESAISVSGLEVKGTRGEMAVKGVSFRVANGEVFGIGGVDGNGQIELAEALAQVRKPCGGVITWSPTEPKELRSQDSLAPGVEGPETRNQKPETLEKNREPRIQNPLFPTRIGYIPQDRQSDGLALGMSILDNLLIQGHRKPELSLGPLIRPGRIRQWANDLVQTFKIAIGSLDDPVSSLSGGNQQKVVVARTLEAEPSLLVAVNPTRGLDLQATNYVHQELLAARARGAAVILFSTDLEELDQLADRTVFMSGGIFMARKDAAAYVGGGG